MKSNNKTNFWQNKKVFVTGHTGFKGSWLCIFLKLLGAKITGYSLKPKSEPNLFNLAKVNTILEKSIFADIRDYKKLFIESMFRSLIEKDTMDKMDEKDADLILRYLNDDLSNKEKKKIDERMLDDKEFKFLISHLVP